ncbi:glycogen synthase GlgA [Thorsellia anophelis]|uniref:Glycogen synthase n=1 Tax=Thorsellia anophelis DSM 18579 TaxID=1123402 RepID=A0A1I0CNJ2_9GAMM|nr:glycogen synthase GlgA [Thorsellia anophelis]SET21056.1 starch synthase [Thorsellia anophelis DSM 18579]
MRVLHVCSEYYPLLKTGGLADVIGALPQALNQLGADSRILIPAFPAIWHGMKQADKVDKVTTFKTFAGEISLFYAELNGTSLYLIDAPYFYDRPGSPYHDSYQNAYPDNAIRFALLGYIACEIAKGLDGFWRPEIVNAHDWHAGIACAYLAYHGRPAKSVFTIHNLAYPGCFPKYYHQNGIEQATSLLELIGLPEHFFNIEGLEFHGQVSYLKAGVYFADHVTTVSPTYANEICSAEYGGGFDGLLQTKRANGQLSGILNGVDYQIWSPNSDTLIKQNYSAKNLDRKSDNKRALQDEFDLTIDSKSLIFAVVSRLSWQKGLDLVLAALPNIIQMKGQLVLLGTGEAHLQHAFEEIAKLYPDQVAVVIGYDEALAHRIIAGADVLFVPSRFEPCGLTQLYSLKYGTLPLVRRTGGLADSVVDTSIENLADNIATGFVFERETLEDFQQAIRRSFTLWNDNIKWKQVQKTAMDVDFSWEKAAKAYLELYRSL